MRVGIIGHKSLNPSIGGIENYVCSIIKNMSDIQFFSCEPNLDMEALKFPNCERISINAPGNSMFRPFIALYFALLLRNKVEILHLNGLNCALFSFIIQRLGFKKVVFTYHSNDYIYPKWGWIAKLILKLSEISLIYSREIVVIAVSKTFYKFLRDKVRYLHLIENAIESKVVEPVDSKFDFKGYILCVGRITKEKGQLELLKQLEDIGNRKKLIFAGPIGDKGYYKDLLFALNNNEFSEYIGKVDNRLIPSLIRNSDLIISNSFYEGLPIAAIEALVHGKRVLLRDIAAHRDLTLQSHFYFEKLSNDLLKSCSGVVTDELRAEFSEKYSIDSFIRNVKGVYIDTSGQ